MRYSNIHTHTTYSDGKQTVEENILAAIALGMPSIGFSDHGFTEFDQSYCIKKENVPSYIAEVRAMGEKYKDQIEVYLGLEADGYTNVEDREKYDYLLGDCHYVKTENGYFSVDHCIEWQDGAVESEFGGDYVAYARAYYEGYAERMAILRPHVLGHFDVVTKFSRINEEDVRYRAYAAECLLSCLHHTPIVELNTGAIARGYRKTPYPASYLMEELRLHGGRLALGSDSHTVANLAFGFGDAIAFAKAHGFRSIVALKQGKWEEIGI